MQWSTILSIDLFFATSTLNAAKGGVVQTLQLGDDLQVNASQYRLHNLRVARLHPEVRIHSSALAFGSGFKGTHQTYNKSVKSRMGTN